MYPKDLDAPSCGVDDMTKLAYLHEPGVLYNLRCRYDVNEIYVSSILLDHVLRCIKINDNFLSFLSDYTFTLMTF